MSDTEKLALFLQGLIEGKEIVKHEPTRAERARAAIQAAKIRISRGAAVLCSLF